MALQSSKIRKMILKQRGVELEKHTRNPIAYPDLPAPFLKTTLMRLLEITYSQRIQDLVYQGSIYETADKLGIDATTISKWRKIIREAEEREWFKQFE